MRIAYLECILHIPRSIPYSSRNIYQQSRKSSKISWRKYQFKDIKITEYKMDWFDGITRGLKYGRLCSYRVEHIIESIPIVSKISWKIEHSGKFMHQRLWWSNIFEWDGYFFDHRLLDIWTTTIYRVNLPEWIKSLEWLIYSVKMQSSIYYSDILCWMSLYIGYDRIIATVDDRIK